MRLLILGAAGFIGSHLVRHAAAQGLEVVALCRSGKVEGFDGRTFVWALGQPVPVASLGGVDCAVHLAHDFSGEAGARLTQEATLACVAQLRAAGVRRQIFFSSYSAGPHAESIYGRTKHAIERELDEYADVVIVRPGLVLGDGGLYGRIRKWARRLPLIPLPDGGRGQVPVISVERLCRETLGLASMAAPLREANLFDPNMHSLRQLVLDTAAEAERYPWVLPVPSMLVIAGLRLAEMLRLPLPVNADNLSGFLANQQAQHVSTIKEEKT
ncbi:MAG: NAD(P)H-binding protein [Methylococcus sp.]|nr:NAD(P)H-binding protein [Methylococcus sp.]